VTTNKTSTKESLPVSRYLKDKWRTSCNWSPTKRNPSAWKASWIHYKRVPQQQLNGMKSVRAGSVPLNSW